MIRLPDDSNRVSIIGRTGSGKSQAAVWQLSKRSFHRMPWVIFDFKRDKLLAQLGATEVTIDKPPPKRPGLYIARPMPDDTVKDGPFTDYLWRIWQQEHTGIYTDEGYMIGNNNHAFRALLTQGRSKLIPMITLTQRPVAIDRFVFSESDFMQVFHLVDRRDRKTVQEFVPFDMDRPLDVYYSRWYDVAQNEAAELSPVPDANALLARFRARIGPKRKGL